MSSSGLEVGFGLAVSASGDPTALVVAAAAACLPSASPPAAPN
jgi:hypothetical protein